MCRFEQSKVPRSTISTLLMKDTVINKVQLYIGLESLWADIPTDVFRRGTLTTERHQDNVLRTYVIP